MVMSYSRKSSGKTINLWFYFAGNTDLGCDRRKSYRKVFFGSNVQFNDHNCVDLLYNYDVNPKSVDANLSM